MKGELVVGLLFAAGFGFGYWLERSAQVRPPTTPGSSHGPSWQGQLDPSYQQLVDTLQRQGFGFEENAEVCGRQDVVGYYTWGQRNITICTNRISRLSGGATASRSLLQQTIAHEATHVAQSCRLNRVGQQDLGLGAARLGGLPQSVQADIEKAVASSHSLYPRSVQWRIEAEAMAMETTPEQVIAALDQFCG